MVEYESEGEVEDVGRPPDEMVHVEDAKYVYVSTRALRTKRINSLTQSRTRLSMSHPRPTLFSNRQQYSHTDWIGLRASLH